MRKVTWYMLPAGATCSMISFFPAYAPTLCQTEGKAQTCELWFRRPASWGLLAWGVDPCVA